MIILGGKYKFTEHEMKILNKKFQNIEIIPYSNRCTDDVLDDLYNALSNDKSHIIILNTFAKVDDRIIKYLTDLKFIAEYKDNKIITIEHFLENELRKCFIPPDNNDLHFLEDIKPYTKFQYFQKRLIDIFGISFLFFFTLPIMLYCAYKIHLQSPGGLIFRQKRITRNNKEFVCFKFRSMNIDAEKNGIKFATANDDRAFPFGLLMRKLRFDELPQLFNVLIGDMHLIGPRPERKFWIDQFEKTIPYYNERHVVPTGITGWAQVNYPYGANAEDARQKLMYDLYYIKYWNISLEIEIVIKTIFIILNRKGM